MLAQEGRSMWRWGLLGHRWGRLEGPAVGTWVAIHRTSDAGVHILADLHKPTGALPTLCKTLVNLINQEAMQSCLHLRRACRVGI